MSAREKILDAAAAVMTQTGLAKTTTKAIARTSGYSEAAIYKFFDSKTDLFLCVLTERMPQIAIIHEGVSGLVGSATVKENLEQLCSQIATFYRQSFPIAASILSDTELLQQHRVALEPYKAGPEKMLEAVQGYLEAEMHLGRLPPEGPARAVAELLVGACFQRAFFRTFRSQTEQEDELAAFSQRVVGPLLTALSAQAP